MNWVGLEKTYCNNKTIDPRLRKATKPNLVWTNEEEKLLMHEWNEKYKRKYDNGEINRQHIINHLKKTFKSNGFERGGNAMWSRLTRSKQNTSNFYNSNNNSNNSNNIEPHIKSITIEWLDGELDHIKRLWNEKYSKLHKDGTYPNLRQCISKMADEIESINSNMRPKTFNHYVDQLQEWQLLKKNSRCSSYSDQPNRRRSDTDKINNNVENDSNSFKVNSAMSWTEEQENLLREEWINIYEKMWTTKNMSLTQICKSISKDWKEKRDINRTSIAIRQRLANVRKQLRKSKNDNTDNDGNKNNNDNNNTILLDGRETGTKSQYKNENDITDNIIGNEYENKRKETSVSLSISLSMSDIEMDFIGNTGIAQPPKQTN